MAVANPSRLVTVDHSCDWISVWCQWTSSAQLTQVDETKQNGLSGLWWSAHGGTVECASRLTKQGQKCSTEALMPIQWWYEVGLAFKIVSEQVSPRLIILFCSQSHGYYIESTHSQKYTENLQSWLEYQSRLSWQVYQLWQPYSARVVWSPTSPTFDDLETWFNHTTV